MESSARVVSATKFSKSFTYGNFWESNSKLWSLSLVATFWYQWHSLGSEEIDSRLEKAEKLRKKRRFVLVSVRKRDNYFFLQNFANTIHRNLIDISYGNISTMLVGKGSTETFSGGPYIQNFASSSTKMWGKYKEIISLYRFGIFP